MPNSNWRQTTLGAIARQDGYGLVDGPFGSNLPASEYVVAGIPVLRGSNLSLDLKRFVDNEFVFVSESTAERLRRSLCGPDDIIFTKKGTLAQTAIIPRQHRFQKFLLSSNQMKLTVDPEMADPLFVYYYVSSSNSQEKIIRDAEATGVPKTNLAYIKTFPITLPSVPEQRSIARVLGVLDDKIELNRRMNETLESIAQALFKSWFVDFDLVRAKAASQTPPGLEPDITALFPDRFEQSELGQIPSGWHVSTLRDLASKIQYGLTQSASTEPVGPHFLRITDIQGGRVDWGSVPYCKVSPEDHERYRIEPADVLVARTGASTGENIYLCTAPDTVFASYLVRFQFEDPAVARLVGAFMRTLEYFEFVAGCIGGSAQPNASAQVLAGAPIVSPTPEIARHFAQLLEPLDQRIAANNDQSLSLAALRDLLLPKLLSGEIRVKDASKEVRRARQ